MGIALVSFGLVILQLLGARVLALVAGDHAVPAVLGAALLGIGAGGALAAALERRRARKLAADGAPALCLLGAAAVLAALLSARVLCEALVRELEPLLIAGRAPAGAAWLARGATARQAALAAALALPHLVSGFVLALRFRAAGEASQPGLYARDLLGAGLGGLTGALAMEYGGWRGPVALAVAAPLAAAAAFSRPGSRRTAIAGVLAVWGAWMLGPAGAAFLEPRPGVRMLSGVHDPATRVIEEWRAWNAYTRTAALRVQPPGGETRRFFAFGTGQGRADVPSPGVSAQPRVELATALGAPARALVLFAGAGSEAAGLDALTQGRAKITAVEVNRPLARWALSRPELRELFARVDLRVEEARSFLERDASVYDLILAPYFGSGYTSLMESGDLARFTYTAEAYRAMLRRLAPEGRLIVFDVNKVVLLSTLRLLFEEMGRDDAARCAAVLSLTPLDEAGFFMPPPRTRFAFHYFREWNTPLDNLALVVKPSGLTPADVAALRAFARARGLSVLYDPESRGERNPYARVLRAADWRAEVARLEERSWVRLGPLSDDRPLLARRRFGRARGSAASFAAQPSVLVLFAGCLLALGAGRVKAGGARPESAPALYFALTSAAFILVETALILKLGLLLGSPVLALAVGLGALLVSAGLGSRIGGRAAGASGAALASATRRAAAAVVVTALVFPAAAGASLGAPAPLRAAAAVALLTAPGFFLGALFPGGLILARRRQESWPARAWALSGFMSAAGAAAAALLTRYLGYAAPLWLGAGLYFVAASCAARIDRR